MHGENVRIIFLGAYTFQISSNTKTHLIEALPRCFFSVIPVHPLTQKFPWAASIKFEVTLPEQIIKRPTIPYLDLRQLEH